MDDDRYSGSFSLCIDENVDYDYRAGAIELTDITNWCSPDAAYNNLFATPDGSQGSCWTGTSNNNVWFKFTAETPTAIIDVKTGTVYGNMRRQQLALWNEAGAEVGCARWTTNQGRVTLTADTLTPGHVYYISVDDDDNDGSFTLCIQGNPLDADITGGNVSCSGASDGYVVVSASGGTETGYTYSWTRDGVSIAPTTDSIGGLDPGLYEVTVTDIGDGSAIRKNFTVTEESPLTLSLSKVDETCAGDADGSVTATAGGGTETAYFYEWFRNGTPTGDVSPTITGLTAGRYKVIVTDAAATVCTITDSIEVISSGIPSVAPSSAAADQDNFCAGDFASITLSYSGGSLGTGATAEWYDDPALANNIGSGNNLTIAAPATTTIYYVRFEGDCNTTAAISETVVVNPTPNIGEIKSTNQLTRR